MIETNTTKKDWEDFWESVSDDREIQSIPQEPRARELFESNDDDHSLSKPMTHEEMLEEGETGRENNNEYE